MGGGNGELQGPDLRAGVPLDELAEGEPFAGHADGEAVILVRRGDEVLAVAATCTHWGGPLAEGLVTEETVRCPWHHACFSLRTGEALGPPALNALARWDVSIHDGTVRVATRHEPPSPASPRHAAVRRDRPERIVVVGAGAAGSAAAERLRREGHSGEIVVVDPDEAAPYDRPNLSKDYLAGTAPEEWIPLRPDGFYGEHGIARVHAGATRVDPNRRVITLSDGEALTYDALLLAQGAAPVRLRVPGAELPRVHVLRSLADCRSIIRDTAAARRAVIVGAGFLGLESAAALRTRKLEVSVVEPAPVPFARVFGEGIGSFVRELHEENGVAFHMERSVVAVDAERVHLDDGTAIDADLVLVAIGVRPATELGEAAGADADDGLLVDDRLETSVPGIFAAGDAARFPDPRSGDRIRVEHWAVAQALGQAAASAILTGERIRVVPFFWTQHYDVSVTYVGHAARWDEIRADGDPRRRDCAVWFVRDGRRLALAAIGRSRESLAAHAAMEREARAMASA